MDDYIENLINECGAGLTDEPAASTDEREMAELARELDTMGDF